MPDELASDDGTPRSSMRMSRNARICFSLSGLLGILGAGEVAHHQVMP